MKRQKMTRITHAERRIVTKMVEKYVAIAERKVPGFTRPRFHINLEVRGRAAGWMKRRYDEYTLGFNMNYYRVHGNNFLIDTIPHEVAHLVAEAVARKNKVRIKGHGEEWQAVMRTFDVEPEVRHNYSLADSGVRTFLYHCSCSEFDLTTIRHSKIVRGKAYTCKKCKTRLERGPLNGKPAAPRGSQTSHQETACC